MLPQNLFAFQQLCLLTDAFGAFQVEETKQGDENQRDDGGNQPCGKLGFVISHVGLRLICCRLLLHAEAAL